MKQNEKKHTIVVNQFSEKTYAIFDGSLIAMVSFTRKEDANTTTLKGIIEELLELQYLEERRELDHQELRSGKFDDKIKAWEKKHPEPTADVKNVVGELKRNPRKDGATLPRFCDDTRSCG